MRVAVCFHERHLGGATRSVERIVPLLEEFGWEFSSGSRARARCTTSSRPAAGTSTARRARSSTASAPRACRRGSRRRLRRRPRYVRRYRAFLARAPTGARARELDPHPGRGADRPPRRHPDRAARARDASARPARPGACAGPHGAGSTRSSPSRGRAPRASPGAGDWPRIVYEAAPMPAEPAAIRTGRARSRSAPSPSSRPARAATCSSTPPAACSSASARALPVRDGRRRRTTRSSAAGPSTVLARARDAGIDHIPQHRRARAPAQLGRVRPPVAVPTRSRSRCSRRWRAGCRSSAPVATGSSSRSPPGRAC